MKIKYRTLYDLGLIRDHFLYSHEVHGTDIQYSFFAEKDLDADGNTNVYVVRYDWGSTDPEPVRISGAEERELVERMLKFAQVRQEMLKRGNGSPM